MGYEIGRQSELAIVVVREEEDAWGLVVGGCRAGDGQGAGIAS